MMRSLAACVILILLAASAFAASGKRPAPAGAFPGAPGEYTRFTTAELTRGFIALAFGSELRTGTQLKGIHRFERPIRVLVVGGGSVDRTAAMRRVVREYGDKVPNLRVSVVEGEPADVELRLIDEKNFYAALTAAFGTIITKRFVAETNPQCMTHVASQPDGDISHSISFIIVDKGEDVFLDCAYHELLHAFGLSNHDQRNPWTTLNQRRVVGYLTVYDQALLTLLYDRRLKPGMPAAQVRAVLPGVISDLGLGAPTATGRRPR